MSAAEYFGAPEAPPELPVPLDAETPTKKGAGKKRKAKEPQVRPPVARATAGDGGAGAERIAGRPLGAHICPPEALPLCPARTILPASGQSALRLLRCPLQPTRRSLRETRKLTPKAAAALAGEGEEEEAEEEWEQEEREAKALRR